MTAAIVRVVIAVPVTAGEVEVPFLSSGTPCSPCGIIPVHCDFSRPLLSQTSMWTQRLSVVVSWQSPGQYYFKPMMKEFRFEPSSQMIEVQEGQNLKITITGYRTAYR